MDGVPTLILNHDTDIDLVHDTASKQEYALKVKSVMNLKSSDKFELLFGACHLLSFCANVHEVI